VKRIKNIKNNNMTSNYKFTYIIGYKHSIERFNNLKRVLDWLSGFTGVEVIIVEQDRSEKLIPHSLGGVKKIFIKTEKSYNRSWGFNVGLRWATTDIIVFGDSDLIMDPNKFIESLNLLNQYECVSPYSKVIDLNQGESVMPFSSIMGINREGRGGINLTGGIIFYRRDSILKISGWDQSFIGWGGEDDFQTHKTKMFLSWKECEGNVYHLYHDRQPLNGDEYNRNLMILEKLVNIKKPELERYIQMQGQKIGFKNSYSE
jgi:glycosyltransferase involved in cell wall biosynthesis